MSEKKLNFAERVRENWLSYSLFLAMIPSTIWWVLMSSGVILKFWKKLNGFLPENIYYRLEEMIALNSHNNDFFAQIGFYFIFLFALVFQLLKILRILKVRFRLRDCFAILIFAFFLQQVGMCLCINQERSRRSSCKWNMKYFDKECRKDPQWKERFPDKIPELTFFDKYRNWNYPGAGKSVKGERFIVLEDLPGTHAGNACHRLWSDGEIEIFYPWKK